jgi:long-subunit fatty acid transport protein
VHEWQENLLTLGLVYHTPFTAKMDRQLTYTTSLGTFPYPKEDLDIDFPASIGAGANYRISDAFSVAFDVEWKDWSEFEQNYADGTSDSPYDSDILAYRLGAERLWFSEPTRESVFALRGGVFYEPRPVLNYDNELDVYGISTGFGWTAKEQFSLDFAYQFRWGNDDLGNIDYDIKEHLFIGSLIIYF